MPSRLYCPLFLDGCRIIQLRSCVPGPPLLTFTLTACRQQQPTRPWRQQVQMQDLNRQEYRLLQLQEQQLALTLRTNSSRSSSWQGLPLQTQKQTQAPAAGAKSSG